MRKNINKSSTWVSSKIKWISIEGITSKVIILASKYSWNRWVKVIWVQFYIQYFTVWSACSSVDTLDQKKWIFKTEIWRIHFALLLSNIEHATSCRFSAWSQHRCYVVQHETCKQLNWWARCGDYTRSQKNVIWLLQTYEIEFETTTYNSMLVDTRTPKWLRFDLLINKRYV